MSTPDWIITFSGRRFYPLEPDAAQVDIRDIAHSLAAQCRYTGHTRKFYSVAEHSVRIAQALKKLGEPVAVQRWGLLHDASEAYLSDIPRPIKKRPEFAFYMEAEARIQAIVAQVFGLVGPEPPLVKKLDGQIIGDEARKLLLPALQPDWELPPAIGVPIAGWGPAEAEEHFIIAYEKLFGTVVR